MGLELSWQLAFGFCDLGMGSKHIFVPQHVVCSQKEVDEVCKKFGITVDHLPKIKITDAALAGLEDVAPGKVIKILRTSPVTGEEAPYYRKVVE